MWDHIVRIGVAHEFTSECVDYLEPAGIMLVLEIGYVVVWGRYICIFDQVYSFLAVL